MNHTRWYVFSFVQRRLAHVHVLLQIHGRPYPLKGRFFANIFVHFEPTGHSLRHNAGLDADGKDVHEKYRESAAKGVSGHENENSGLPPYIKAGSPEATHWKKTHPTGLEEAQKVVATFTTGSTNAHEAAKHGKVDELHEHIKKSKEVVHAKDENGWTPLHEGVRGGHADVVKLLIQNGANVNETTANGESALWWAKQMHGEDHPVVQLLEELGALMMGPEL
jgi:prolyl 4-hydroxylase